MEGFPASEAAKIIGRTITSTEYPEGDVRVSRHKMHSFAIIVSPDVGSNTTAFHTLGSRYIHYFDPKFNEEREWLIPHKHWSKFDLDGTFHGSEEELIQIGAELASRPTYMCAVLNTGLDLGTGVASLWNANILDSTTWDRDAFIPFFKEQFGVVEIMMQPNNGNLWIYPNGEDLHTNQMFNELIKLLFVVGQLISEMSKKPISEVRHNLLAGYLGCHCALFMLFTPDKTVLSDGTSMRGMTVPPPVIWNEITRRIQESEEFVTVLKEVANLHGERSAMHQLLNRIDPQKFPMEPIIVNNIEDLLTMLQFRMRETQINAEGSTHE